MALFFTIYVFAIRPLRDLFSSTVAGDIIFDNAGQAEGVLSAVVQTRSVIVTYLNGGTEMVLSYIPQFGFFFLLSMLGLIFFNPKLRLYGYLAGFHAGVEAAVLLSLVIGVQLTTGGFIFADFLMLYLSPLVSLGFVVYASLQSRREKALEKS
jgi:hypothetical protein